MTTPADRHSTLVARSSLPVAVLAPSEVGRSSARGVCTRKPRGTLSVVRAEGGGLGLSAGTAWVTRRNCQNRRFVRASGNRLSVLAVLSRTRESGPQSCVDLLGNLRDAHGDRPRRRQRLPAGTSAHRAVSADTRGGKRFSPPEHGKCDDVGPRARRSFRPALGGRLGSFKPLEDSIGA